MAPAPDAETQEGAEERQRNYAQQLKEYEQEQERKAEERKQQFEREQKEHEAERTRREKLQRRVYPSSTGFSTRPRLCSVQRS